MDTIIVLPEPNILYFIPGRTVIVGYETYGCALGGRHQEVCPDITVYTPQDCPEQVLKTIGAHLPWARFVKYDTSNPWGI